MALDSTGQLLPRRRTIDGHLPATGRTRLGADAGRPERDLDAPGRPAVPATLTRADDLLIRLTTGEYVNAQRAELAFSEPPPVQGGMTLKLRGVEAAESANLAYRTQALFWRPHCELNLNGAVVNLAALAQLTNLSDQVFSAQTVDLYGGSVQQPSLSLPGAIPLPNVARVGGTTTATSAEVPRE